MGLSRKVGWEVVNVFLSKDGGHWLPPSLCSHGVWIGSDARPGDHPIYHACSLCYYSIPFPNQPRTRFYPRALTPSGRDSQSKGTRLSWTNAHRTVGSTPLCWHRAKRQNSCNILLFQWWLHACHLTWSLCQHWKQMMCIILFVKIHEYNYQKVEEGRKGKKVGIQNSYTKFSLEGEF